MAGANYTSKRQYLSQDELAEYADITITDENEADTKISQAEELIDAYVGFQHRAVNDRIEGRVASATSTTVTLEASNHQNVYQKDYLRYCQIEIVGGTGVGQRQIITGSTYAGVVTTAAWTTTPDSTSYYKITQLGKFPRSQDQYFDGNASPQVYVKSIPEAIKRATAAQVEYIINQGDEFFSTDQSSIQSEHIGNYSYTRGSDGGSAGTINLIAPKAKSLLKGIVNRKGTMIV